MFAACCKGPKASDDTQIQIPDVSLDTVAAISEEEGIAAAGDLASQPERVILISDNLPSYETLVEAAKTSAIVVLVRFSSWSLQDLVEQITEHAGAPANQFKSVAILDHGKPGEFCLLKNVMGGSIDLKEIKESEEVQSFLRHIARYVQEPKKVDEWKHDKDRRIDLLGCNIAEGRDGAELIEYLEELTGVNWCASTDKTGAGDDAENGFDWVMETDLNVGCVADDYFDKSKLAQWRHVANLSGIIERATAGITWGDGQPWIPEGQPIKELDDIYGDKLKKIKSGEYPMVWEDWSFQKAPHQVCEELLLSFNTTVLATVEAGAWRIDWIAALMSMLLRNVPRCAHITLFAVKGGPACDCEIQFIKNLLADLGRAHLSSTCFDSEVFEVRIDRDGHDECPCFVSLSVIREVGFVELIAIQLAADRNLTCSPALKRAALVSAPVKDKDDKPIAQKFNEYVKKAINRCKVAAESRGFAPERPVPQDYKTKALWLAALKSWQQAMFMYLDDKPS
eukprot:TRINITY_DN14295_c0_g1_i1.p1 TRINITY_DN14295_c0_g1~~TRINITY_DN14295_c0_g1_i1.p1  ORF type:complete len:530 (+),score=105.59 TRINITY_DN14295_c0_g1_i1:63-1592(+)